VWFFASKGSAGWISKEKNFKGIEISKMESRKVIIAAIPNMGSTM
jgi:hypothetical protein